MDFLSFHKIIFFTFFLFVSPFLITSAQPYKNISLGSSIVAQIGSSTWKSPSGDFAFGFQPIVPDGSGYLLAIWFDKIPEKTLVWAANRHPYRPAEEGSKIQLYEDGRFELTDASGQQIWMPDLGGSTNLVAYGAMLDTGDFVLATNTSIVVWNRFSRPTMSDTILPSQILNSGDTVISRLSETNYSRGPFALRVEPDRNVILYSRNIFNNKRNIEYWSSNTTGIVFQLIFNQSGNIILRDKNGTILSSLSSSGTSTDHYYQRGTIDLDGVFRHYSYPKVGANETASGSPAGWSVLEFQPPNICTILDQNYGSGACGFNGLCTMGNGQKPDCVCPTGYSKINTNDRMSGCRPDFIPQSCHKDSQDSSLFTFVDMLNTDWPLDDYDNFDSVGEDWCRQACLDDCFCAVAIFRDNTCWKKRYPLSNGRIDSSVRGKALIKIRRDNATSSSSDPNAGSKQENCNRSKSLIAAGSVLLGSSVFMNLVILAATLLFVARLKRRQSKTLLPSLIMSDANFRSFSFSELQEATNGFKEILGTGACSTVFKGILKNENGKTVAIKRLDKLATEAEQVFRAEVSSIRRTNHKNLVQLLGYCDEDQNRLLVYEFMTNGSVASVIFQHPTPNWHRRLQIIIGTARGLCYLHEECSSQIIHCDIKPQNVLLDELFVPKISDFGLAKLLKPDQTRTMTGIRGTRGYVAPEWFRSMPVTTKVDVYSFGILLLELVCCRRHVETKFEENEAVLAFWADDCYRAGTLKLLVSKDEEAMANIKRVEKLVMIALWCIQDDPSLRPNMKRVILMLEGTMDVPIPPELGLVDV